jgi:hypothetical protein
MYRIIANGKVWHDQIKNRAKDGSFYWVDTTIVPTPGEDGKPIRYISIRADITALKKPEKALRRSLASSEAASRELADQKFALFSAKRWQVCGYQYEQWSLLES